MRPRGDLERLEDARLDHEPGHEQLLAEVDQRTGELLERRDPTVQAALERPGLAVRSREHPRRRALEDLEVLDVRLDLGDELDRRGARPDRRDALAPQVVVMVPLA